MYNQKDKVYKIDQTIIDIGNELIKISNNEVEYGIGIKKDGTILHSITSNQRRHIRIPQEYGDLLAGGTFIHNHPEGSSLSFEDFKMAHRAKCEIYTKVVNGSKKQVEGFYVIKNAHNHDLEKIKSLYNKFILKK